MRSEFCNRREVPAEKCEVFQALVKLSVAIRSIPLEVGAYPELDEAIDLAADIITQVRGPHVVEGQLPAFLKGRRSDQPQGLSVDRVTAYVDSIIDIPFYKGVEGVEEYMNSIDCDRLHVEEVCALLRLTVSMRERLTRWGWVMGYVRERLLREGLDEKEYLAGMI